MTGNCELRVAGIGGGTGLPVVLRALSTVRNVKLTGIVAVSDNGGSSGRLRRALGIPAVGDLRNCLVALSGSPSVLRNLFQHRFSKGDIEGHSLGNLIVAALFQKTGSLTGALQAASELLVLDGRALPSTESKTTLCARFDDGYVVKGETQIAAAQKRISRVWLEPANPAPSTGVLEAIHSADAIVLAPGSLYSSLLPNLLVAGVADAIRRSPAAKILVCNLMTQPGETAAFAASDHLRVVESVLGRWTVGYCIVNTAPEPKQCSRYRAYGSNAVQPDLDQFRSMGVEVVAADLMSVQGGKIRHNPARLGRLILKIARNWARDRAATQAA